MAVAEVEEILCIVVGHRWQDLSFRGDIFGGVVRREALDQIWGVQKEKVVDEVA